MTSIPMTTANSFVKGVSVSGENEIDFPEVPEPFKAEGNWYVQKVNEPKVPFTSMKCNSTCNKVTIHEGFAFIIKDSIASTSEIQDRIYLCTECGFTKLERGKRPNNAGKDGITAPNSQGNVQPPLGSPVI
jgi:hypothetical protein